MNKHFFIPLVPTKAETPKRGAATHFAKHKGIVEFPWDLAAYIASEIGSGNAEPKLFVCAWYNSTTDEINVGFEIPRTPRSYAAKPPRNSASSPTLECFYTDGSPSTEVDIEKLLWGSE